MEKIIIEIGDDKSVKMIVTEGLNPVSTSILLAQAISNSLRQLDVEKVSEPKIKVPKFVPKKILTN